MSNQKKNAIRLFALSFLLIALAWICSASIVSLPDRILDDSHYIGLANSRAMLVKIEKSSLPLALKEMPDLLLKGVVFQEDQAFFSHRGYHLREMRNALQEFLRGGKLRGASTITQQLARTLFLNRSRTALRKTQELYLARLLERSLQKPKILELYLNTVYWGKNRYGIKAAARYYFNKEPAQLNAQEIAFLISLLPNPDSCQSANCNIERVQKRSERLLRFFNAGSSGN